MTRPIDISDDHPAVRTVLYAIQRVLLVVANQAWDTTLFHEADTQYASRDEVGRALRTLRSFLDRAGYETVTDQALPLVSQTLCRQVITCALQRPARQSVTAFGGPQYLRDVWLVARLMAGMDVLEANLLMSLGALALRIDPDPRYAADPPERNRAYQHTAEWLARVMGLRFAQFMVFGSFAPDK